MLRATNISFYKIMSAGYISAETYSVLEPKVFLCNININEYSSYSTNIAFEIRRLFENDSIYESICGMEQMELCMSNDDKRPYILLEMLLPSSDNKVKDFLSKIGIRTFFLDFVFSNREKLCTRLFINDDNINTIADFIDKYEEAFLKMFSTRIKGLNQTSKEQMTNKDYQIPVEETGNPIVGEYSDLYNQKNVKSRITRCSIDDDAVSSENADFKDYVVILSQLTDEEFEPFKVYLHNQLAKISIRATNCIKAIGYRDFYVNYLFAKEVKILSIRNFGKRSFYDLRQIRQSLIDYVVNCIDHLYSVSDSIKEIVHAVSEEKQQQRHLGLKELIGEAQYFILNGILQNLIKDLSVRARNAINNYHGDFIEDFIHKDKSLMDLNNIGRKTSEEIKIVVEKLRKYAEDAKKNTEEEISQENLQVIKFQMYFDYCWDDFSSQYFLNNGHLPMFHILENWINNCTDRGWKIFKSSLKLYAEADTKSLDEVANVYRLSRERCRQICNKHIESFRNINNDDLSSLSMNLAKIIAPRDNWQYLLKAISCNNLLDTDTVRSYIYEEQCDLSSEFCFFIMSILLKDEYSLVGHEAFSLPTRTKQIWRNSYMIKKEYTKAFNFIEIPSLITETERYLTEDLEITAEQLVIDTFIGAWNDFDTNKVYEISDILSHIMIQEFGMIPDENFKFTLESKNIANTKDIIYDILSKNGSPMTTDNIYAELENVYPNRYKSSDSVRLLVGYDPRICMTGEANYVGLLEWQHVKVGSIRDIIVQYLSKFDEPQPAANIVKYIQQYRNTSERSIRSSMSSGSQFVTFSGGLYGLKDKAYVGRYKIPEKRMSFSMRVNEMENFLRKNLHFPFYQSDNSTENSLYNWWKRMIKSEKLSEEEYDEIKRIQEQYKDYPTTHQDNKWNEFYKSYKEFLQNYGRKPQQNNSRERQLFSWFEKCASDFREGNLSSYREKMYIELCNLL